MDAVLPRIFAVPFYLPVQGRVSEGGGQVNAAISLDPPHYVTRRGIQVWATAMAGEFKLLAMRGNGCDYRLGRLLARRQRGRGQDATHDDAGVHVPWL